MQISTGKSAFLQSARAIRCSKSEKRKGQALLRPAPLSSENLS
jgi:hypothetical protein